MAGHSGIVSRLRAAGCVYAEDEARLLVGAAATPAELESLVARRVAGLPLEQVLGWAEFCGHRILVEPGVFVPRRRSEFLARRAAELVAPGGIAVEPCCGTGAISAVLARAGAETHATDLDPVAVGCARRNLEPLGGRVYEGDLFAPLPAALAGRVAVIAVVPPYVPSDEIELLPREARDFEKRMALDGGADGLDILRRILAEAQHWLAPGGHLLAEVSERQAPAAVAAAESNGLAGHIERFDDLDSTVLLARVQ